MEQKELEYARLSGIEIPKELLKAVEGAQGRLLNLQEKSAVLEAEKAALENEINGFVREEATAVVDGTDTKKLAARREKSEKRRSEIGLLLAEIAKLEVAGQASVKKAEEELNSLINERLAERRQEMRRQLEAAMNERGRNLNQIGQIRSTPPERSSQSRIAVCEICTRDIAIFDPLAICQPVTAGHFEKLPRLEGHFNPKASIEWFQCPFCAKKPWGEHDRILTNTGYFFVPEEAEKKEEKEDGR